jgi:hypothetical protein
MAIGDVLLEVLASLVGEALGALVRRPARQLKLVVGDKSMVVRSKVGFEVVRLGTQLRFTRDFDGMPRLRSFGDLDPSPDTLIETQLSLRQVLQRDGLSFDEAVVLLGAVLGYCDEEARRALGLPRERRVKMGLFFDPELEFARRLFGTAIVRRSADLMKRQFPNRTVFTIAD